MCLKQRRLTTMARCFPLAGALPALSSQIEATVRAVMLSLCAESGWRLEIFVRLFGETFQNRLKLLKMPHDPGQVIVSRN
jgi:hypothetical protein